MGVPPGGIVRPNAAYLLRYLLTSCLEVMINIVLSSFQHCTGRLLSSSAFKANWLSNLPIIWWWQIVCNGIYKSNLLSYGKIKLIPCHQVVSSHVFMVCHDSSETRPYRQFKVSRTQSGSLMLCTKALQAFCEKNFFCAAFFNSPGDTFTDAMSSPFMFPRIILNWNSFKIFGYRCLKIDATFPNLLITTTRSSSFRALQWLTVPQISPRKQVNIPRLPTPFGARIKRPVWTTYRHLLVSIAITDALKPR